MGATAQTGISASVLYKFRKALGLEEKPILVHEPYQMLGHVDEDVRQVLDVDVIGLWNPVNFMGVRNESWKPWEMPDGTPVLMAGGFEYDVDKYGNIYTYPQGDRTAEPSMKMPAGGYFFDNIDRSKGFDEDNLDPRGDYGESFSVFDEGAARYLENESKRLYRETDYAVVGNFGCGGFGDVANLPGADIKNPWGIRKMEDWLMAHILYPEYILEVFEMQAEAALENLEIYKQAVGDRIQVIWMSGTDFGTQSGEFTSPEMYRKFYKPYHKKLNDWVHKNTNWKTFYHTCGSIVNLLDDMAEAGVDILNPVQLSAAGMDPKRLKKKYKGKLVFWGGGVDTQHTLPFGTREEVCNQVKERMAVFSEGGGFVFNTIHNIVAKTPVDNLLAMYETVRSVR